MVQEGGRPVCGRSRVDSSLDGSPLGTVVRHALDVFYV